MTDRSPDAPFGLGVSNCRSALSVVDAITDAETRGAAIAFIAEDINCRDAFELGVLGANRTEQIRIATGVVNPYTRNPTSLAMAVATLDEVSNGRATLGLGTSSPSLIETQMGISVGKSIAVMREATEVIRALLAGERLTYSGERFTYRESHLEVRPVQPRIPIFFAAMGPKMLRLAGRLADGVLLNVGASTDYVRWALTEIAAGAHSAGRDPDAITVAAWLTAYVTDDYESGLERARAWLARMLSIPRQGELLLERSSIDVGILPAIREHVGGYPHRGDSALASQYVPVDVAERLSMIGTVEQVRERVEEYRQAGVQLPILGPAAVHALYPL